MTLPDAPPALITTDEINTQVEILARRISHDYARSEDLLLVGVLRGAFVFLADLARRLEIPHAVDFIAVASYEAESDRPSGAVRLVMDLRSGIGGRDVLLVEDIVDTGHTIAYLRGLLAARNPESLKTCALVRKPSRIEVPAPIDYLGFDIPDIWVVGYGLDYANRWRTLPYIGVYEPEA